MASSIILTDLSPRELELRLQLITEEPLITRNHYLITEGTFSVTNTSYCVKVYAVDSTL